MIATLDQMAECAPVPVGQFPVGHMSLLEMINFHLRRFIDDLDSLDALIENTKEAEKDRVIYNSNHQSRILTRMDHFSMDAEKYGWIRTLGRSRRSQGFVASTHKPEWRDLRIHLQVLREALLDDISEHSLFHYDANKVKIYKMRGREWQLTISSFKATANEIAAATDCYALGYNTASVFHLMRIAEHGLRALSYSLGVTFPKDNKPIEWAEWQNLIEQIGTKGETQASALPKGPLRDQARDFYSGAASHFAGFKDKYRNAVMHVRADYDEGEAWSAMIHVREFMNGLSRKIDEDTKQPIQWS